MNSKSLYLSCALLIMGGLEGAPGYPRQISQGPNLPQIYDELRTIQHQLKNQAAEISQLREETRVHEEIIDDLSEKLHRTSLAQQQSSYLSQQEIDPQLKHLSEGLAQAIADVKKLRDYIHTSNEKTGQKQSDLEELVDVQQHNILQLQTALHTLFEALEIKDPLASTNRDISFYKVQSGDSLGKIAIKHNTTVSAIKKANDLKNDKIITGQKLKIPSNK